MRFIRIACFFSLTFVASASITRTARLAEASKTSTTSWTTTGTATASAGDTLIVIVGSHQTAQPSSLVWNGGTVTFATSDGDGTGSVSVNVQSGVVSAGGTGTFTVGWASADSAHALLALTISSPNGNITAGSAVTANGGIVTVSTGNLTGTPNSGAQVFWLGAVAGQGGSISTWTIPTTAGQSASTSGGNSTTNTSASEGFEIDSSTITQALSASFSSGRNWGAVLKVFLEPSSGATAMKDSIPLRGIIPFPR